MDTRDPEALAARGEALESKGLNGMKRVLVSLHPPANPTRAELEVAFFNDLHLAGIAAAATALPRQIPDLFPIRGGHRLPAGPGPGQVKVTGVAHVAGSRALTLTVFPIGDYSSYRLGLAFAGMDPIFSELSFKFRPHCFSSACAARPTGRAAADAPDIDYLAKDYASFRHLLMGAMAQRVPGWRATSEADLDQTLIDLMSAAGDELSDYQDRVMNEAYLASARKRVSLARHARLMDYRIHQGNQASTWLALELAGARQGTLPADVAVRTGRREESPSDQLFLSRQPARVHYFLNRLAPYDWSGTRNALPAGSTSADLRVSAGQKPVADLLRSLICEGSITHLLIQEHLNPATGLEAGRDPTKRQLLELRPCGGSEPGAEAVQDPFTGDWLLRVRWLERDHLRRDYCLRADCPQGPVAGISLFHGNLLRVYHGRAAGERFAAPGSAALDAGAAPWEKTRWGTLCRLRAGPLAYRNTAPGGEVPPVSSLRDPVYDPAEPKRPARVLVELADGSVQRWSEQPDLVHSKPTSRHYRVETDEEGRTLLRFGNSENGRRLPADALVHCHFQVGEPLAGNLGADALVHLDPSASSLLTGARAWNPFDVTDGRAPEPRAEIVRRVPEAYRQRQLRAVTLKDYERRAEEVDGVSRAAATYGWSGSWRTVRVILDPRGTTRLSAGLRARVAEHLETVRLLGDDVEIRAPRFVPLSVRVVLCVQPGCDFLEVQDALEQVFGPGYRSDGCQGFFHPDRWTFGQTLHASQILGPVQAVTGVHHVVSIDMARFGVPASQTHEILGLAQDEVLLVRNDPDHLETGFIRFEQPGEAL